jgi:hypothetical protein
VKSLAGQSLLIAMAGLIVIIGVLFIVHPRTVTVIRTVQAPTIDRQARQSQLGVCVASIEDGSSGDVASVTVTAPDISGGAVSCTNGTFVSIVPTNYGPVTG